MKKKGFSFIEILVVFSVIALLIPAVFAIIFAILRQQTKILRMATAKREGDYALNIISNTVRDRAISLHSGSPPDDTNVICKDVETIYPPLLYFQDDTGAWFGYALNANKISSSSSVTGTSVDLTSNNTYVENFAIGCKKNAAYSYPYISISFDICYKTELNNCASQRPENLSLFHYQSQINLRNSY